MPAMRAFAAKSCRALLDAGFLLLCLRFQVAAVRSAGPDPGPAWALIACGLGLGAWNARAALFAFTLAMPLLLGLGQDGFLGCPFPLSLVFSALWTGIALRRLVSGGAGTGPTPEGRGPAHPHSPLPRLVVAALVASVILSLAWQLWRHRNAPGLLPAILDRATVGFGDPWYFLTSAYLWLQGLVYFEALCPGAEGRGVGRWVRPVAGAYFATMAVFVLLQFAAGIPEGWTAAGIQAPFEDISSFGSVAVALFIFAAATLRPASIRGLPAAVAACAALLFMVAASWSRAAWLAGVFFLVLVALLRLSRLWAAALVALLVASILLVDALPNRAEQLYLSRLHALVRLESPASKGADRFNLYAKAAGMVRNRPMTGHGIGSFYLDSVNYARPGDPLGAVPEFAHNAFLQVAAEQGVPTAALLAGITAWALWAGLRAWMRRGAAVRAASLPVLGATLALGAYLQTQMTSNSLNVYVSNQFFFWFLLAAILSLSAGSPGKAADAAAP